MKTFNIISRVRESRESRLHTLALALLLMLTMSGVDWAIENADAEGSICGTGTGLFVHISDCLLGTFSFCRSDGLAVSCCSVLLASFWIGALTCALGLVGGGSSSSSLQRSTTSICPIFLAGRAAGRATIFVAGVFFAWRFACWVDFDVFNCELGFFKDLALPDFAVEFFAVVGGDGESAGLAATFLATQYSRSSF